VKKLIFCVLLFAFEERANAVQSCAVSVGPQRAAEYVRQCLEVSPATHPPCNANNSCDLIIDEIVRGCALLSKDAPGFCKSASPEGGDTAR
jgi:hypothetical protein